MGHHLPHILLSWHLSQYGTSLPSSCAQLELITVWDIISFTFCSLGTHHSMGHHLPHILLTWHSSQYGTSPPSPSAQLELITVWDITSLTFRSVGAYHSMGHHLPHLMHSHVTNMDQSNCSLWCPPTFIIP